MRIEARFAAAACTLAAAVPAHAQADTGVIQHRGLTFLVFGLVIASTLLITYYASRSNRTAGDFYTAGPRKTASRSRATTFPRRPFSAPRA
jgi:cation/acetate symporter